MLALLMVTSTAVTSLSTLLPCTPGQQRTYRWLDAAGQNTDWSRTERTQRRKGRFCFVRRMSRKGDQLVDDDVYVLEYLRDRILDAGWKGQTTAFRPPRLRVPLQDGQRWRFNRVEYRLDTLPDGHTTPAGHFPFVIRVRAESIPRGRFWATYVYAPGIGLIEERVKEGAWILVRTDRTDAPASRPASQHRDGTGARLVPTWTKRRAISG